MPHIAQPTPEQVDAAHEAYVQALIKLFNDHKDKYNAKELSIIG